MNKLTRTVTVPLAVGSIVGLWLLFTGAVSWWAPLICYFIFGVIINGTIAHRYFSHNNFWVPESVRKLFGMLVVLGGYGLPLIWVLQHRHHHTHSDNDKDVHTPKHGFWHAFIGWHCSLEKISAYGTPRQIKLAMADPIVKFTTEHYFTIIWGWMLLFLLIDWKLFLAGYCLGIMLEHVRLGLVNTICHYPNFPGNYKPYKTSDQSQNNILIGILGFGFGWHNTHHCNPGRLILSDHWWEIDVEGYIGWGIKTIFAPFQPTVKS